MKGGMKKEGGGDGEGDGGTDGRQRRMRGRMGSGKRGCFACCRGLIKK